MWQLTFGFNVDESDVYLLCLVILHELDEEQDCEP